MIRPFVVAVALAALVTAGCGSSEEANLSHFTGAPWATTSTGYTFCNGASAGAADTVVFGTQGAELTSVGSAGCAFHYTVVGDVATMSNGPVDCNGQSGGLPVAFIYTRGVVTTSDGHHLTAEFAGTYSDPTVGACPFEYTLVGTR